MVFQWIDRIVSRTNNFHIHAFHDGLRTKFRGLQFGCTFVVYFTCSWRIQHLIDTEYAAQFQVSPVVKRVAHSMLQGIRPFLEFLECRFVAGDILFGNTVCTHGTPFVMVSAQPNLCQVGKLVVVGYLLRDQMTMIVNDRHLRCMFVIQFLGCLCL